MAIKSGLPAAMFCEGSEKEQVRAGVCQGKGDPCIRAQCARPVMCGADQRPGERRVAAWLLLAGIRERCGYCRIRVCQKGRYKGEAWCGMRGSA